MCEGLLFCCRGIKGALQTSLHNRTSQSLPSQVVIASQTAKYRISFLLSSHTHTHTQTPDLACSSHSRCSATSANHILPPEVCRNPRRSVNVHAERKCEMEDVSGNIASRHSLIFLLPRREQNKEFPPGGKSCRLLLRRVHVASLLRRHRRLLSLLLLFLLSPILSAARHLCLKSKLPTQCCLSPEAVID